jgi:hypothetical protein
MVSKQHFVTHSFYLLNFECWQKGLEIRIVTIYNFHLRRARIVFLTHLSYQIKLIAYCLEHQTNKIAVKAKKGTLSGKLRWSITYENILKIHFFGCDLAVLTLKICA